NRTLMQIRLPAGGTGRKSHHRHHGIAAKDDDAHIRHALIAQALEYRQELHHVFDDDDVLHATQAELTVDGVRDVVRELLEVEQHAADRAVARAAASCNDDDAIACAAV